VPRCHITPPLGQLCNSYYRYQQLSNLKKLIKGIQDYYSEVCISALGNRTKTILKTEKIRGGEECAQYCTTICNKQGSHITMWIEKRFRKKEQN